MLIYIFLLLAHSLFSEPCCLNYLQRLAEFVLSYSSSSYLFYYSLNYYYCIIIKSPHDHNIIIILIIVVIICGAQPVLPVFFFS